MVIVTTQPREKWSVQVISSIEELEAFARPLFSKICANYALTFEIVSPYKFLLFQRYYALYIASDRETFTLDYIENYQKCGYQMIGFWHLESRRKMVANMALDFGPSTPEYSNFRSLRIMEHILNAYCKDLLAGDTSWIQRHKVDPDILPSWLLELVEGRIEITY